MKTNKWVHVGNFGVDSGQVLITDPCYLRHWQDNQMADKRSFRVKATGKTYRLRVNFTNFETEQIHNGKNMNQLIASGEVEELLDPTDNSYSYAGACDTTIHNPNMAGELVNKIGAEMGVALSTGYGDGCYPVYTKYKDGRIQEVKIKFF